MPIKPSELILNPDGSVYHLNLLPQHIANTVITVGDPDRVDLISSHFEHIEFKIKKREFHTQTGVYKGKRITVISTGIGTDNIDIVLNELDALVNIDFSTKQVKKQLTSLQIIRIGTSGSCQKNIAINSFVVNDLAVGFDGLLHFYDSKHIQNLDLSKAIALHTNWSQDKAMPYVVSSDYVLLNKLHSNQTIKGFAATNIGFYGPQGRVLRLAPKDKELLNKLSSFTFQKTTITNLEMETAGMYGLSKLLGHKAVSINAILANRVTNEFSEFPKQTLQQLIIYTLNKLAL